MFRYYTKKFAQLNWCSSSRHVLFNDTIYYNIAYGLDNASKAAVEKAADDAQIHDFIMSLPDGYEQPLVSEV